MNIRAGQIYFYSILEGRGRRAVVTYANSDGVGIRFINSAHIHQLTLDYFLSKFTLHKEHDFYTQLKDLK